MNKKFNLRQDKTPLLIDPATIPITISAEARELWMAGDTDPFFKIQKIDYPIKANGDIYTESFFQSFINSLPEAPIPGARDGHNTSWGARANTDFIMAGARLDSNGDGAGSVYFKNYIPKEGNETFIKELKSNMVEFSLVAYVKEERVDDGRGNIEYHVVEALSGFRNDAVDVGSMEQKLNNFKEGEVVKKEEIFNGLLTLKTNNEITLVEIAKHLGLENQIVDEKQRLLLNSVISTMGDDPITKFNEMKKVIEDNATEVRQAKLNTLFGEKTVNGKPNEARDYAENMLKGEELTEEKINSVKESSAFKALASLLADVDSDLNRIGKTEKSSKANTIKEVDY